MEYITKKIMPLILCLSVLWIGTAEKATGEEVLRHTLQNGLRVVIVQNTLAPVVTTEVNYLAGSNEARPGFPGMAHAQEHMMFRGSPGLSASQLATLIAAMGGKFDADTQETVTQYFFTVPADDLETSLKIEAIRMGDVLDSEDLWLKERGAIDQEVAQDYSNPLYLFYKRLLTTMFAGTPYAHTPLGTKSSFQETTGAMLKAFYNKWYAPNNAIMVIVGDVDPRQALDKVKNIFEGIQPKSLPARSEITLQELRPSAINMDTDLPYGLAVVAYRLPGYGDPDYTAGQILADVLGSQRGNLYALVPEGKALLFDFNTSIFPGAGMGYAMAGFPQGGDGSSLLTTMKNIIADYVNEGIPADLVEAAKRLEITDAEFQKNSISGLASAWSQAMAVQSLQSPAENIEALKRVTPEDVNRVAQKYLINKTATVGLLTPSPSEKTAEVKAFHGRENFAPSQVQSVPLPEWAKDATELPTVPKSRIEPVDMKLPNGLRLIVQPATISRTVGVYGEIKNNPDLEVPRGQEGLDEVLDTLFSYGTKTLDRLAFQKALDDIGARASAGTSFSLQVMDKDFEHGVRLLADNLLHPALDASAFQIVKNETAGLVAGRLKSPDHLFKRALHAGLYPENDPVQRQATPETVDSLTLSNVRDYYRKVFRPDLTTIVVIGNIIPGEVKKTIAKYFESWQSAGKKPPTELPPVPLNKPARTTVPDAARIQDLVVLAQTLGLTRLDPDYYTLQVGNHILSGAFYATRLYRDLRQKTGLVYMVESALEIGKTRGTFEVVYACDPPNVGKARGIVEQDLLEMQNSTVGPDELRQAKTILIREIPLSESSTYAIAAKLLHYSLENLPLDEKVRAAGHYLAVTPSQLQRVFSRYIRPADFVQVTLGPSRQ